MYDKEIKKINADIDTTVRTANESYSLTRNMIEFIHKYEPVYIQRQITQALQNIFPDPNVQWRLSWFNDIKMPLLTTLLMYKSEVSLEENMKKFDKVITLNSLTAQELFIKNAAKNNTMQQKSIEIIQDAMKKIMDSESENSLREVNTDAFILRLNNELMMQDPAFAASMGITPGEKGGP